MLKKNIICGVVIASVLMCSCSKNTDTPAVQSVSESEVEQIVEVEDLEPELPEDPEPEPATMSLEDAQKLLIPDENGIVKIDISEKLVALSVLVNSGDTTHYNQKFVMQSNLSLSGMAFSPIGGTKDETSSFKFGGTFDGGNFILSDLTVTAKTANSSGTGFFGAVSSSGSVSNIHITGGIITGQANTAGVAGYNEGTLYNCSFRGTVYSDSENIGGICGLLTGENATIESCFANVDLSGNSKVGGLVGATTEKTIVQNCYALGKVNSIASSKSENPTQIGGFIGRQEMATIANCYSYTEVFTRVPSKIVGAFIGYNAGTPKGCYYNQKATKNWQAVDANLDNAQYEIKGCTVEELLEKETYIGWDFESTWAQSDTRNRGLPYLQAAWD